MLDPVDVRYFKLAVGSNVKYETPGDICVRCPICGDSKYSKNKARLHLYTKGDLTLVNCFNECSCRNKTVYKFLKDYYPSLLDSYKQEKFRDTFDKLKQDINFDGFDLVGDLDLSSETKANSSDSLTEPNIPVPPVLFDMNFFSKSPKVYDYIESRGLEWSPCFGDFFLGKRIQIDSKTFPIDDFIVIPFYCGDKCYGFYSRSLREHRFYTYMPEKNSDFKLWNYYNIDRTKPVYVTEGIFDAMSLWKSGITNVVACCGATPPEKLLEGLDCIMCFDNDQTGKKNAIKYAKKGFKVLVYPDDLAFKDFNEMLLNNIDINNIIKNVFEGIQAQVKIQKQL